MALIKFRLNSDQSVMGVYDTETGKVKIFSNHSNLSNDTQIVKNLERILRVEHTEEGVDVLFDNERYVHINTKDGTTKNDNALTSFETRLFSRISSKYSLPFERPKKFVELEEYEKYKATEEFQESEKKGDVKVAVRLGTDLHTHFAAALSPSELINCGESRNCRYPGWLVKKLNLNVRGLVPDENGSFLLDDLISDEKNKEILINSMKIDTSEQETFNKMEEIYAARGPITKNPETFIPMLKKIIENSAKAGVTYLEFSLSSIISDMSQLKKLENYLPEIEKETGVTVRFLGAISRHSDKEWNDDEVERLIIASRSPYIVGCDFMGHETNPTSDFYEHIKKLARHAMLNDPDFVIRVHAGENVLFKSNVRQVLLAVEEAHYELERETGKKMPFPQVRIGHGLYGFNEPASWDEQERTKTIKTSELFKIVDPIVEFNMSSNLSLNNIDGLEQIPIAQYIKQGVRVVLGTDGCGIYSTSIEQEMIIAHAAGVKYKDFEKIAKTEKDEISRQKRRFERLIKSNLGKSNFIGAEQKKIVPHYTKEVEQKHERELQETQARLQEMIKGCGAITDIEQIKADLQGKTPILLTGSSHSHFPNITCHPEQLRQLQIALDALVHLIDTEKAYIMTGGTNHGVERELHIIANEFNQKAKKPLIVLGTLTEEAAKNSNSPNEKLRNSNKIEKNTITHAITPVLNGKIAKRWFDLPDTVLSMVQEQNGEMIAIGGGAIVGDMILRAHNMGINMHIMSTVEGASKEKSQSLEGFGYDFKDAEELIAQILKSKPELFKTTNKGEIKRQIQLSAERVLQREIASQPSAE